MIRKLDRLWVGLTGGILLPLLIMFIYYLINFSYLKFYGFIFKIFLTNILTPLLSLCVVGNLGLFYLAIQTYYYHAARGVLAATIIYAIVIFILKLSL